MNTETFVYVTYIAATPEKIWTALTQGELIKQWWRINITSDWKQGSTWEHISDDDARTSERVGKILESIPNKQLTFTWITPKFIDDRTRHSKVNIDLETVGTKVKMTVTHSELTPEGLRGISFGWPLVLSSLKSFIETGEPLEF